VQVDLSGVLLVGQRDEQPHLRGDGAIGDVGVFNWCVVVAVVIVCWHDCCGCSCGEGSDTIEDTFNDSSNTNMYVLMRMRSICLLIEGICFDAVLSPVVTLFYAA